MIKDLDEHLKNEGEGNMPTIATICTYIPDHIVPRVPMAWESGPPKRPRSPSPSEHEQKHEQKRRRVETTPLSPSEPRATTSGETDSSEPAAKIKHVVKHELEMASDCEDPECDCGVRQMIVKHQIEAESEESDDSDYVYVTDCSDSDGNDSDDNDDSDNQSCMSLESLGEAPAQLLENTADDDADDDNTDDANTDDANTDDDNAFTVIPVRVIWTNGKRAHQCTSCNYQKATKAAVQAHIRKEHVGAEQKRCGNCSYKTHNPDQYRRHKIQCDVGWLCCVTCSYKSLRKSDFVRHSKTLGHVGPVTVRSFIK